MEIKKIMLVSFFVSLILYLLDLNNFFSSKIGPLIFGDKFHYNPIHLVFYTIYTKFILILIPGLVICYYLLKFWTKSKLNIKEIILCLVFMVISAILLIFFGS